MHATLDLSADPVLPFPTAVVASHEKGGVVSIESRPDGLYLDARRVILYRSERQVEGIQGTELYGELEAKPVLNANVLHFLVQNSEFIPRAPEWRKEGDADEIMVYFWGTLFGHPNGDHCVMHMEWNGATWKWSCSSVHNWWLANQPAALLEG